MAKKSLFIRSVLFTVIGTFIIASYAYDQIGIKNTATFPFPIKAKAYQPQEGFLFVGAHQVPADPNKGFSIALAGGLSKTFSAYVDPEKIHVNGVENQNNPLRGSTIALMSLLTDHPVVVTDQEPTLVQVVQFPDPKNFYVLRSAPLIDALGHPSSGIEAIAALSGKKDEEAVSGVISSGMPILAAVRPQGGVFGNPGSGIAIVLTVQKTKSDKNEPGNLTLFQPATRGLDITSPVVKINSTNLVSLQSPILLSDPARDIFYAGFQGVGGAGATDGLQAVIGIDARRNFSLFKLIPDTALTVTGDYGIAAVGASKQVSIFNLALMQSTTRLSYLVVVGGSGNPATTQKTVYALPLVNETGRLASKTAVPVQQFASGYPYKLLNRALTRPVITNADLFTQSDVQIQVGAGVAPGPITDMVVNGDAVFVSVAVPDADTDQPGIFCSQALFDQFGRIKGWTTWRRCAGFAEPIWGFALDGYLGNFWALTGSSADTVTTVKRTKWGQQTVGLGALYNQFFPTDKGGAQGIFDFSQTTPGFSTNAANRLAVTLLTGYQQVLLAQTGISSGGLFGPNTALGQSFVSADGTLRSFAPGIFSLACSGGALASLGAIIAATVVNDGNYGWFVVGGSGGIAVLANEDGTGFNFAAGLQSGFVGLSASMRWIKLGTTTQVRKLMAGNGQLFALTNTTLERFTMSAATIQLGSAAQATVLARAGILAASNHAFFSDMIISQAFGLLATTGGLLRVGNGANIMTATDQSSVNWTAVPFNESVGPVSRLYGISVTGREEDLALPGVGGNIYFLNSFVGFHQTRLYRFTLDTDGVINTPNISLQKFPDCFVKDTPTFYLNVGDYRNYLATDGAMMALSQSRYVDQPPFVEMLTPNWQLNPIPYLLQQSVNRAQKVVQPLTAKSVDKMLREFASGAWIVGTDVGLFANE